MLAAAAAGRTKVAVFTPIGACAPPLEASPACRLPSRLIASTCSCAYFAYSRSPFGLSVCLSIVAPRLRDCGSQKLADTSLLFLFNVRTRLMLGVFAPDGPAGLELEPSAFGGGGRFPVQVRFQPVHPSGQVLSVPEAALGEVLRYRNASTRFDLLLRGRAVDKIVGIFSHRGTPIGGLSLGAPGAVPISPDLMGASAAVHDHPPPQQPPLPQPQARQQPPLLPQPAAAALAETAPRCQP